MRTITQFITLFLMMLPFSMQGQSGMLTAEFGQDSLYACANEIYTLTVEVDGGTAPYTYNWSIGSTDTSLVLFPTAGSTLFFVTVTDDSGLVATDSVFLIGLPECVFPGDANGDGAANNLDLLSIGDAYGIPGMTRPDPHFNWIGQPAPSWTHTFNTGVNYAHADANGNGLVDAPDIYGITHNYLQPQALPGGSGMNAQGVPLYLDIPVGNNNPGDTVVASIMLGTSAFPADSIYGIAFSISYDAALIDSGSARIDFTGSWLGDTTLDLKGIARDFANGQQIDIAMTRIDHLTRSGYGRLADIIITIDDIAGKSSGIKMLNIDIGKVWLIGSGGMLIDVSLQSAQVAVVLNNDPLPPSLQGLVSIFPNPASEQVSVVIDSPELAQGSRIEWVNTQGQLVYQKQLSGIREEVFSISTLPTGLYFVRILTHKGVISQKIFVQ